MPEIGQDKVRISIPVGDEEVVFICRQPTAKEVIKFLGSRYVQKRNKVETRLYEARQDFVHSILLDVENVTFCNAAGESLTLNAQTALTDQDRALWATKLDVRPSTLTWMDLIPLQWKSCVAMFFEDAQSAAEGN